jgi:hypothetical protein
MNVAYKRLLEYTLDQLSTSGITNKSIQKDGLGKVRFIKAILNYPNSLHLLFEVDSSHDNNQHFSLNGQLMAGLSNGYAVQLHFVNISNIMPPNFTSLPYTQQSQILQLVFDQADVKVSCDCGAFYWQGMHEEDSKKDTSYYSFSGQPGTGAWQDKHVASGLPTQGQQECKHIYSVAEQLNSEIPNILKYLGSGATTSTSASTEQTDELQVQEQPAGLPEEPKQGVPKETTINAPKAAQTVSADIEAVKSNNEIQNAPTLNTSEVEAKSDVAETEAQEGTEPAEPPIEKPTVPDELADKKAHDKENNILEEPYDTQTKHAMNEDAPSITLNRLYEELFYRGYRNYPLFQAGKILPNDTSKLLYVATDPDHAYQFATGQTTTGDEKVFEVYDIPVQELKVYNLQTDPNNEIEASHIGENTYDEDLIIEHLKAKGYDAWTKLDYTVHVDEDDMPGRGREMSRTWELAVFDKNRFKPIDRVVSSGGEFSDKQLKYLISKYDMQFLKTEMELRDWGQYNYDDGQADFYDNLEAEAEKRQASLEKERNIQDDNQTGLFDDAPTDRQTLRKKMMHIVKSFNEYGQQDEFEKIWEELLEQGYTTQDIVTVNKHVFNKMPTADISEGYTADEMRKANELITQYINDQEDEQLEESFEHIYASTRLTEKMIDIRNISLDELKHLTSQDIKDKLEAIKQKPNWHFATKAESAWDLIEKNLGKNRGDYLAYLSISGDVPVGFILFTLDKSVYPQITEIYLVGFKENSVTLVKDVLNLLDDLRLKYDIHWTVLNENPIKRAYDKKVPQMGGTIEEGRKFTLYTLEKRNDEFQRIYEETGYRGLNDSISAERGDDFDYFQPRKSPTNAKTIGKWYSSSKDVASTYGKNITKAELEFDNPMVVDAEGEYWNHFWVDADEDEKGAVTLIKDDGSKRIVKDTSTDKLSRQAKKDGHDGLIVKNVEDVGHSYGTGERIADDIVALKPEVIKSEEKLTEAAHLIGDCRQVGSSSALPWDDVTDFAQDLGYYATFDRFEDPADSNYEEISEVKFQMACAIPAKFFKKKHTYLFLKHREEPIYIAYDEDDDIHYIFQGEQLQEAIYTQRKMFYHISYNSFSKFESRNQYRTGDNEAGGVFLTPSLRMIQEYLTSYLLDKYRRPQYYLYRCFLTDNLNIFNPSNNKDRAKLLAEIKKDPKGFYEQFAAGTTDFVQKDLGHVLTHFFTYNGWSDAENPAMSKLIKKLGFDGYESTENDVTNTLVFDANKVKIPDGGPYKTVPAENVQEIRKFFGQFNDELESRAIIANNRKTRGNVDPYQWGDLERYKLDDIFAVKLMKGHTELKYDDLSMYFDYAGKLSIMRVMDEFRHWFDEKGSYIEYDDKHFADYTEFESYLKDKFAWTQADNEDFEEEEEEDDINEDEMWDEED